MKKHIVEMHWQITIDMMEYILICYLQMLGYSSFPTYS